MKASAVTNGVNDRKTFSASGTRPPRVDLTRDELLQIYRWMVLSRRLDDKEIQLKNQSRAFFQISGAGHEAIQIAAARELRAGYDWFYPYYRDRALCLVLGVTAEEMLLASVGSKDDPASRGRQMPSHWGSPALHIVSGSSPTGTQLLQAVGCADATLLYERLPNIEGRDSLVHADEITFTSVGDGSTGEGEFWESINTASGRRLPIVFLVEDNGYAISTPSEVHTPGGDISRLVENHPHLKIWRVDGTKVIDSCQVMREAVAYARARKGPALVHARVTRPYSHSLSDDERLYKTAAERAAEAERDPITLLTAHLKGKRLVEDAELDAIRADVDREVNEAADCALKAPRPDPNTATLWVYSPDIDPTSSAFEGPVVPGGKPDTMVGTINQTLKDEMTRNPRMVIFGQDVADCSRVENLSEVSGKGGVFKVTHGLQRLCGSDRIFNSPLAEANIVGRAIGMATRGLRPVVEIQFFDYIWPAMMQIRDEMTMLRYRSGNSFSCPMVIRVPIGGYLRGGGPYHSQSGESIFGHCPGLRIAFPSDAVDAAGLLRTAIRCDDPVLFLEHKHLYRQPYNKGPYPGPDYMLPFAKAALRREGDELVIVTWGALVHRTLLAAHQAEKRGIHAAVLDLRTLAPYDWPSIVDHVKRTSRIIVAHEDQMTCGFGAEIAARVGTELFEYLDAPILRVGARDVPVAYAPELEEAILPQTDDLLKAIEQTARY
ncbi:MAG TPA: dehydrogenase E1 component subunit alpha/beta [Vicinamibacterales bacterium]|jgi:2-oxoisovalerate dehydrogenase E1 component